MSCWLAVQATRPDRGNIVDAPCDAFEAVASHHLRIQGSTIGQPAGHGNLMRFRDFCPITHRQTVPGVCAAHAQTTDNREPEYEVAQTESPTRSTSRVAANTRESVESHDPVCRLTQSREIPDNEDALHALNITTRTTSASQMGRNCQKGGCSGQNRTDE
jgi:hypothetical protein